MPNKIRFTMGLIVLSVVLFATGVFYVRQQGDANKLPTFKLATNTWVGYGPLYLAQEKGYFKDEGVDVQITTMEDVAQRKAALIKGDVDAVGDTVDSLILARDQKVPGIAVMELDVSNGADGILATKNIKTVADIKGKTVAVQRNFVSESFLDYVLIKNGLKTTDVTKVDTEAGAAGAAFVGGSTDVAVTYEPWLSKAKERAGGHVLVSSADEPEVLVDIMSVSENYINNHPKDIQKVMRAWFKAVDYWKNNPSDANEIMSKQYNSTAKDFADLLTGLKWVSYDENVSYFGTPSNHGKFYAVSNIFNDVFISTGQIKNKVEMTNAVNTSMLDSLYANR